MGRDCGGKRVTNRIAPRRTLRLPSRGRFAQSSSRPLPLRVVLRVAGVRAVKVVAEADDAKVAVEDLVMVVVLVRHRAKVRRAIERHLVAAVMRQHVEDADHGE
eukprot:6889053-Prymnesium_polylepis.2